MMPPGFGHQRARPAVAAEQLWRALKRAKDEGLTAGEAGDRKIASIVYARKTMRAWVNAGLATYTPPDSVERDASGRYRIAADAAAHPPMVRIDGSTLARKSAAMKPEQFAAIRRQLGLSLGGIATALGWTGLQPTRSRAMRRFESGEKPIDAVLAAKVRALKVGQVAKEE